MHHFTRVVLLSAALCACSKSSRSAPATVGSHEDAAMAAGSAADAVVEMKDKGAPMTPEQIARDHYAKKGWTVAKLVAFEHVPHLFRGEFSDGIDYVLVHQGNVLEAKGVDALSTYAREAGLVSRAGLDAQDLTTLLFLFDAYPPVTGKLQRNAFYNGPEHPPLKPTFKLDGGTGKLVLNYILPPPAGAVANPKIRKVQRWTLTMPKDGKLAWTSEEIDYNPGSN